MPRPGVGRGHGRGRREPVRLLHAGDHRAARRTAGQGGGRDGPAGGGAGAPGPPVPLHRLADHRRRLRAGRRPGCRPGGRRPRSGGRRASRRDRRSGPATGRPRGRPGPGRVRRRLRAGRRARGGARRRRRLVRRRVAAARPGGWPARCRDAGRRSSRCRHSSCPTGDWALTLRTSWVEPAYLEPDAAWCAPGGEPASPVGQRRRVRRQGRLDRAPCRARELAAQHDRPVLVVLSREDVVRLGPKRPPIAAGVRPDGTGVVRVVRTPGIAERIRSVAPRARGRRGRRGRPATSVHARGRRLGGGGRAARRRWAGRRWRGRGAGPGEGSARGDGRRGRHGPRSGWPAAIPLDEVVLRSYVIGAAHMALGWVTSEALSVDADGDRPRPDHPLLRGAAGDRHAADRGRDRPAADGPPVNVSDAVFAAVAGRRLAAPGPPPGWPTRSPARLQRDGDLPRSTRTGR